MFFYDKKLQYPVKIDKPNPKLAAIIISQYGGPDGELGASLRYLSQRYSMPFDELKGLLTDIGTEALKWHPDLPSFYQLKFPYRIQTFQLYGHRSIPANFHIFQNNFAEFRKLHLPAQNRCQYFIHFPEMIPICV